MILRAPVVAVICLITTAACGIATDPGDVPSGERSLVATTTIWADITMQVACGEAVTALIPVGADPHGFEPSLRDRSTLETAALIIGTGGGLEASLTDLLTTLRNDGITVLEVTSVVDLVDGDPHVWQDPVLVAQAIPAIADALVAAGRDSTAVSACADAYRLELLALDAEIDALLAKIDDGRRTMVTSHDSLGYFARRYDLDVIGTVIPSTDTMAQASTADLAALAELIRQHDVPAIFTERLESSTDAEALADRLHVAIVALTTDSLSHDPSSDSYIDMLRANATAIAAALE